MFVFFVSYTHCDFPRKLYKIREYILCVFLETKSLEKYFPPACYIVDLSRRNRVSAMTKPMCMCVRVFLSEVICDAGAVWFICSACSIGKHNSQLAIGKKRWNLDADESSGSIYTHTHARYIFMSHRHKNVARRNCSLVSLLISIETHRAILLHKRVKKKNNAEFARVEFIYYFFIIYYFLDTCVLSQEIFRMYF